MITKNQASAIRFFCRLGMDVAGLIHEADKLQHALNLLPELVEAKGSCPEAAQAFVESRPGCPVAHIVSSASPLASIHPVCAGGAGCWIGAVEGGLVEIHASSGRARKILLARLTRRLNPAPVRPLSRGGSASPEPEVYLRDHTRARASQWMGD